MLDVLVCTSPFSVIARPKAKAQRVHFCWPRTVVTSRVTWLHVLLVLLLLWAI